MNRLVAAGRPAGALLDAQRVIGSAKKDGAAGCALEVAFDAKIRVPRGQQFGVDRSVRGVTCRASLPQGLVLKGMRPSLGGMALKARLVRIQHRGAAALVS